MPNKDGGKSAPSALSDVPNGGVSSLIGRSTEKMGKTVGVKTAKVSWKGVEVVGNGASPESSTEELLGSVTSGGGEGAVRTSARVIKKMKLDSAPSLTPPSDNGTAHQRKDSIRDSDKPDEITATRLPGDSKQPSAKIPKCRTPKALWSSTEKNLFFEALNEYGKDFDSITAYICNKMKRKGVPDSSTKAKHQVSTFYYRTWQKVSKYIKFDDNVKKVVQELYALINYGEMRKRMEGGTSSSKLGGRLGELVKKGVVAVRWRGRTLRVRTPVCRALRTLNQLHEWEEQLRLPVRVVVQLCARDSEAWRMVQSVAHNPRVLAPAPPSLRLQLLLHLLHKRWTMPLTKDLIPDLHEKNSFCCFNSLDCQTSLLLNPSTHISLRLDTLEQSISTDRITDKDLKEASSCKSDDMSDENGRRNNIVVNNLNGSEVEDSSIKTSKRLESTHLDNRIDDVRNIKTGTSQQQDTGTGHRNRKYLHVGPKPGLTFSLPTVSVGEHLTSQRICFNSYQERLRNNSICSGLQNGNGFKGGGRFKNQKRSRKDSGENEVNRDNKKSKGDDDNCDIKTDLFDIDETANDGMDVMEFKMIDDEEKDKDFFSELEEDVGECEGENNKQKEQIDDGKQTNKYKAIDKNKKENLKTNQTGTNATDNVDDGRGILPAIVSVSSVAPASNNNNNNNSLKSWNKDILLQQIKKGWSVTDAGDLTIGDLYLMFGSDSKLELEYWWCEPSPPMQQHNKQCIPIDSSASDGVCSVESTNSVPVVKSECEKEVLMDLEKEPDALLMSPTHTSQDSNDLEKDMMSPDHKHTNTAEDLAMINTGFPLISKIINCPSSNVLSQSPSSNSDSRSPEQKDSAPLTVPNRDRIVSISSRLKKLLSLAKLYDAKGTKTGCSCGHFCALSRLKFRNAPTLRDDSSVRPMAEYPWQRGSLTSSLEGIHFRTPLPKIAVRPNLIRTSTDLGLDKLPPWTKRGRRPRLLSDKMEPQRYTILPRPVVQSVSPNVKTLGSSNTSTGSAAASTTVKVLPKLKPKPCVVTVRPSITMERSSALISRASNSSVDVKPDVLALEAAKDACIVSSQAQILENEIKNHFLLSSTIVENEKAKCSVKVKQETVDETPSLANLLDISLPSNICDDNSIGISFKANRNDLVGKHDNFTGLLPSESMSMSPSRLLKENDDQWLESEVHNFSLSSFLGHLEGPHGASSSASKLGKPDEENNTVDAPLHCLMNDSIDYMAKFEDLAKRVSAEATK